MFRLLTFVFLICANAWATPCGGAFDGRGGAFRLPEGAHVSFFPPWLTTLSSLEDGYHHKKFLIFSKEGRHYFVAFSAQIDHPKMTAEIAALNEGFELLSSGKIVIFVLNRSPEDFFVALDFAQGEPVEPLIKKAILDGLQINETHSEPGLKFQR